MVKAVQALSVRPPHAGLIALGAKTIELRTWATKYRGPLLICSGLRWWNAPRAIIVARDILDRAEAFPRGHALVLVDLVDIRLATHEDTRAACVSPEHGELAWIFERPRPVVPIPVLGRQGVFPVIGRSIVLL